MKQVKVSNGEVTVKVVMENVDISVEEVTEETPTIEVYTVPYPKQRNTNRYTARHRQCPV